MREHFEPVGAGNGGKPDTCGATRRANAAGAETDTITVAAMAALFCTISTETRLVRRIMASPVTTDAREGSRELIKRVVTVNVLALGNEAPADLPKRRGVNRARFDIEPLQRRYVLYRGHDLVPRELPAGSDNGGSTYGFRD
jgi:hypothetical protein